ncbi:hypothetical protein ACIOD2_13950 [Amycolatopsis sp. NPDC088138]|uniref:hypothetical protein n=1 Tax=Amycolatopsis sp. NPDC088138 TaxID=3363938 RepID=UPI0038155C03
MSNPDDLPRTPMSRLLEEISWDGRSVSKYRDGGRGKENVLTAEVLTALDYLPRDAYLANVLRHAHGPSAAAELAAAEAEAAEIIFLPEEIALNPAAKSGSQLIVQPDATITSPSTVVLLEAKAIRAGTFGPEQLAREYLAVTAMAGRRTPLLLLVLGTPPPVKIRGGRVRLDVTDAILANLEDIYRRAAPHPWSLGELRQRVAACYAWLTWTELAELVIAEHALGRHSGTFAAGTVDRLVDTIERAVKWHGGHSDSRSPSRDR